MEQDNTRQRRPIYTFRDKTRCSHTTGACNNARGVCCGHDAWRAGFSASPLLGGAGRKSVGYRRKNRRHVEQCPHRALGRWCSVYVLELAITDRGQMGSGTGITKFSDERYPVRHDSGTSTRKGKKGGCDEANGRLYMRKLCAFFRHFCWPIVCFTDGGRGIGTGWERTGLYIIINSDGGGVKWLFFLFFWRLTRVSIIWLCLRF